MKLFIRPIIAILIGFCAQAAAASDASDALPAPPYPKKALDKNQEATVIVSVRFDEEGTIDFCRIVQSSGHDVLDGSTVSFIKHHWQSQAKAGQTVQVPIVYKLDHPVLPVTENLSKTTLEDLLIAQGFTRVLPIANTSNACLVKVEINGKPFKLLVDTGSPFTLLSKNAAQKANLPFSSRKLDSLSGVNGKIKGETNIIAVQSFTIGGVEIQPTPILTGEFEDFDSDGVSCQGIVGLGTLRRNHAVMVLNPKVLFFNPKTSDQSGVDSFLRGAGFVAVPLELIGYHYYIPAHFEGFTPRTILDTGAYFSILDEGYLEQNNFRPRLIHFNQIGIDGHSFPVQGVQFKEIYFGNFAYGSEMITSGSPKSFQRTNDTPEMEGIVGYDLLGNVLTVLDTSRDCIYFRQQR